mmetsp:Transcript_9653/g.14526  ORF Transcript_9653/g.14526 Transcript_9653/m.14526 type:complete len:401 (+) Transcript_9653:125-1327(+)
MYYYAVKRQIVKMHLLSFILIFASFSTASTFTSTHNQSDCWTKLDSEKDPSCSCEVSSLRMNQLKTLSQLQTRSASLLPIVLSKTVPELNSQSHKGSSGRIGILGGSEKYTGAPYYAAMSSLRTGADLATVFCAEEACTAIKSYSPELMVQGVYSASRMQSSDKLVQQKEVTKMVDSVTNSLDRLHALVIGPGLGRDPAVMNATAQIIRDARKKGVGLVLDADALFLLSLEDYHDLLLRNDDDEREENAFVLTPNVVEYERLLNSIGNGSEDHFRNVTKDVIIVKKGHHDIIERFPSKGCIENEKQIMVMTCEEKGGLKRSGGIGDILAGAIGTFVAWNKILSKQGADTDLLLSCWMASSFTKRSTNAAFKKKKRSMTAPDILEEIGAVVDETTSSTLSF